MTKAEFKLLVDFICNVYSEIQIKKVLFETSRKMHNEIKEEAYNVIIKKSTKTFDLIDGIVLGNYWGGGSGSYKMKEVFNISDLDNFIKEYSDLNKLSELDAGMGFESMIGAIVNVMEKDTILVENTNITLSQSLGINKIGELTEEDFNFLLDLYNE